MLSPILRLSVSQHRRVHNPEYLQDNKKPASLMLTGTKKAADQNRTGDLHITNVRGRKFIKHPEFVAFSFILRFSGRLIVSHHMLFQASWLRIG